MFVSFHLFVNNYSQVNYSDVLGGTMPYILSFFVGYDTIMLNSFIQFNHDFNHHYTINSGMLYTRQFDEVYYLHNMEYENDCKLFNDRKNLNQNSYR